MRLGGSEIAPVGTFPPPLPSRSERPHIRLAFLESHFRRLGLVMRWLYGCDGHAIPQINKSAPAKPAQCGDAGWEDRYAIRGGRRPRAGGAKPQAAALFFLSTSPQAARPKVLQHLALVFLYGFGVVYRAYIRIASCRERECQYVSLS